MRDILKILILGGFWIFDDPSEKHKLKEIYGEFGFQNC